MRRTPLHWACQQVTPLLLSVRTSCWEPNVEWTNLCTQRDTFFAWSPWLRQVLILRYSKRTLAETCAYFKLIKHLLWSTNNTIITDPASFWLIQTPTVCRIVIQLWFQIQGRKWSKLVQGQQCGQLVDTSSPFEESPSCVCTNQIVRLALEQPSWSPDIHAHFPTKFKSVCLELVKAVCARKPQGLRGFGVLGMDECLQIIRLLPYPMSSWLTGD